ncbi:hypothetical protein FIBSPDRAFT_857919 [Athelia psychrophila]|uniref:Uncharacterized protein n=1 Tax=Athelia psychrophila TaxID=1759441 RepID=A0A166MA48_9AGAM|nr:hypothetical protein FIBSPDRAFT_857919 [Fibularhizoctonia sp. CBS 109695]
MASLIPKRFMAQQAGRALYEHSTRQRVEVRIKANIWVAGIIVSTLQFIQNFASLGYEVEYRSHAQEYRRESFREDDVRPVHGPQRPN